MSDFWRWWTYFSRMVANREYHCSLLLVANLYAGPFRSCDPVDHVILNLAKLLKTHPPAFYKLNQIFHPHARVEFDIRQSPIISFVLKTSDSSRIIILDPDHDLLPFHNLSTSQLRDILIHRGSGNCTYDSLRNVTDPALQDCLAQLTQDVGTRY